METKIEIHLDHRYLNETLPLMNTTAENIVVWIYEKLTEALRDEGYNGVRVEFIRLYETQQAMQKLEGSGWKLSKVPVIEILGQRFKERVWSLARRQCL